MKNYRAELSCQAQTARLCMSPPLIARGTHHAHRCMCLSTNFTYISRVHDVSNNRRGAGRRAAAAAPAQPTLQGGAQPARPRPRRRSPTRRARPSCCTRRRCWPRPRCCAARAACARARSRRTRRCTLPAWPTPWPRPPRWAPCSSSSPVRCIAPALGGSGSLPAGTRSGAWCAVRDSHASSSARGAAGPCVGARAGRAGRTAPPSRPALAAARLRRPEQGAGRQAGR